MTVTVRALSITPVKGTRLQRVDQIQIDLHGVRDNRRFFLINERDEMVNGKNLGALNTIVSGYSEPDRRLTLSFPAGPTLDDEVRLGEPLLTRFFGQPMPARLVLGPWSEAISEHVGQPLRLVEAGEDGAVDRGAVGAVSVISQASLTRLAETAERQGVDSRRFRMLLEVDGIEAHEEDSWVGRSFQAGEAVLRGRGHVGRCVITNRHPETGEVDLQTLKILGTYRQEAGTTEPVAFGIYGEVLRPGTVRVGDAVSVDGG